MGDMKNYYGNPKGSGIVGKLYVCGIITVGLLRTGMVP
jgi:hypothetical protein